MKLPIAIIALLFSASAQATPITLQVTFTVESFRLLGGDVPAPSLVTPILVGDKFFASILVDDSILATDGPSNPGKVLAFHARMGVSVWDPDLPWAHPFFNSPSPDGTFNDFLGFRGPCYNPALSCTPAQQLIWGLDSEFFGFEVVNHEVVGLWGGVYGGSDLPYIDFNGDRFAATPWVLLSNVAGFPYAYAVIFGSQDIAVVASPGSLALLMLGLLIGWGRFRPLLDTH